MKEMTFPNEPVKELKTILHLCADIGSDSQPYRDAGYNVIRVGRDIGIENFSHAPHVHGIIANPPCTHFSIARTRAATPATNIRFREPSPRLKSPLDRCCGSRRLLCNPQV